MDGFSNSKLPQSNEIYKLLVRNIGLDNSRLTAHDSCHRSGPLVNCVHPKEKIQNTRKLVNAVSSLKSLVQVT